MSELFRKSSMEKINSPEQLNDYIRVSNPSVWMVLAAVIVLLLGVCVWGIWGHLDTTVDTVGDCQEGIVTCYIQEADISDITVGTPASISGGEYTVSKISAFPVQFGTVLLSSPASGGYAAETWVYAVTISAPGLANGSCEVSLITRQEAPVTFVLN